MTKKSQSLSSPIKDLAPESDYHDHHPWKMNLDIILMSKGTACLLEGSGSTEVCSQTNNKKGGQSFADYLQKNNKTNRWKARPETHLSMAEPR